jgi:hypothetical protein
MWKIRWKIKENLMGFDRLRDHPKITISSKIQIVKNKVKLCKRKARKITISTFTKTTTKKSLFHFPQNFENVPTKQLYFLK